MGWIDGFGNQALAFGALLASVPLIIHIFNRQRHRPMPWAGMQFVMAAYKKTRRRSQFENLLLLLLRMAVIALLAFALSRPFTSSDSPLAQLTEERRDLVLALDVSASTGYRDGADSVYERILGRARDLVADLEGERGDRVRLLTAASGTELLSWRSPQDALSLIATLTRPRDEGLDLAALFEEVRRFAEEDAAGTEQSTLEVRLLTDCQERSFRATQAAEVDDADESDEGLRSGPLDRLHELGVRVLVEDLGPALETPPNLGVTSLEVVGPMLGPGLPTEVGVTVVNHGRNLVSGVRLALFVDGERQPSRQIEVPARSEHQEVFPIVFPGSGYHVVEARLDGDALAVDDSRFELLFVPPALEVLIVNGDPKAAIDEDETGYLHAVLAPLDEGGFESRVAPFSPTVTGPEGLGFEELDLSRFDVVFLANVENVSPRVVEGLEGFVADGGALVISLGDRVSPESYNSRLWRADGSGLLPAELHRRIEVRDRREDYFRAATFDDTHPALAFFGDDRWRPLFSEVPIYAFVSSTPLTDAKVLARLDDDATSPLLLEREYDRGRVVLWTTTIDKDWTRLPESPRTLIPFVHELLREAGRPRVADRSIEVSRPITLVAEEFPRNPRVVRPDGASRPLDGDAIEQAGGKWLLPALPPTDAVGLWRVELEGDVLQYAVQFGAEEGDLASLSPEELGALHPALVPLGPTGTERDEELAERTRSGELWRGFARFCLIALILESLWAGFIGRRRRWKS